MIIPLCHKSASEVYPGPQNLAANIKTARYQHYRAQLPSARDQTLISSRHIQGKKMLSRKYELRGIYCDRVGAAKTIQDILPGCRSSNGSGSPLRYSSVSFSISSDILQKEWHQMSRIHTRSSPSAQLLKTAYLSKYYKTAHQLNWRLFWSYAFP